MTTEEKARRYDCIEQKWWSARAKAIHVGDRLSFNHIDLRKLYDEIGRIIDRKKT